MSHIINPFLNEYIYCTRGVSKYAILQEQEILVTMGTDWSHSAVSNLDFELRKEREFQNSSRGVGAKAPTPPSQRPKFLALSG
jgi:hypothetical protein